MINVFSLVNGRLVQKEICALSDFHDLNPIWVDLDAPTKEEKKWVAQFFSIDIPIDAVDDDIEESARFYENDDGILFLRSDFLVNDEGTRYVRSAFLMDIHNSDKPAYNILFSIHEDDVPIFRLFRLRARRTPNFVQNSLDIMLNLFDTDAEYSADLLESIYDELENASQSILHGNITESEAEKVLAIVAKHEDLNGKVRREMMDSRRAVSFLMRIKALDAEQFEVARQILRDIESLNNHTAFLFEKINFLMDTVVGFLNINQNKIIKIFSVASVALLPPTLIASIYGMNFRYMPEVNWDYGYPFAILLMLGSALIPMLYFRKKGWLR